jgi:hypothetical protein
LPAWKRPCGSRGVDSWRGAHLAMLVVRPFGRCSRSFGLPCSPLDDPVAGSSAGSSTFRSPARLPKEPPDANLSPSPHFGAFTLRPGRFNGLLSWVRPHGPVRIPDDVPLRPSIDIRPSVHSRADPRVVASASRVPPSKSRSVLVVSHHLDGFLRCVVCGLVASRCQSWGPPRCYPRCRTVPLEEFLADSRSASPRSLPPCRSYRLRGFAPSSSLVSPPAVAS